MGNEYAVSIYDGHKEEWTLMGFSAWGWCYPPITTQTFIAQTTVPPPCLAVAWPSASESTFALYKCQRVHQQPRVHFRCPSDLLIWRLIGLEYELNAQDVNGWRQVRRVCTSNLSRLPQVSWQCSTVQPNSTFRSSPRAHGYFKKRRFKTKIISVQTKSP